MAKAWAAYETKKKERYSEWLTEIKTEEIANEAFPYPIVSV